MRVHWIYFLSEDEPFSEDLLLPLAGGASGTYNKWLVSSSNGTCHAGKHLRREPASSCKGSDCLES